MSVLGFSCLFPDLGGSDLSDTGLQKLAFFLLVALILYVSITGGA